MSSELLLLTIALIDIIFVFIVARSQPLRLFGVIVINLILITIFGAKMVNVFGLTTNIGNVFYACAFLATHFLLLRKNKKDLYNIIWIGALSVIFFTALSQITVLISSPIVGDPVSDHMKALFALSPRIVLASLTGYIFAQFINIYIFDWISVRFKNKYLWLQSNGANIISQFVDSCLFFTIAMIDVSGVVLVQAIIAGWLIKIVVVVLGTPFLYLDKYFINKK
jgi:uncharacterized integral membrane protein (TIGR00697 family)